MTFKEQQKKQISIADLQKGLKNGTIKSDNIAEIIPINEDTMVPMPILRMVDLGKSNDNNSNKEMK